MSIREEFEKREQKFMSAFGCLSSQSHGREKPEESCPIRTAFQLDRERIVYSNAFRRMKNKTQVFLSPLGDEYRTRLTHTLEVAQIARSIARAMHLNEDLTEAIALGHDLGHTPFGHSGETALREVFSESFSHNEQSLRVVEVLENNGEGLNLTSEVRDGILKHSKGYGKIIPDDPNELAATIEGRVVRVADIMAYLNHDLDDAIRSGVIHEDQVPQSCVRVLGQTHSERARTMIRDLVFSSKPHKGELRLNISDKVSSGMTELRKFLYDNVYRSPKVHNEFMKAKVILTELYRYFLNDAAMLEKGLKEMGIESHRFPNVSKDRIVCDFIASMTDRYALNLYTKIFFPSPLV
ncbi:MAG: deoxyguanosinetriphosphate triphosphohydrolase [Desulfobacteraceae bacterium IS3]|nr:MAG: deoxyguanosinetriphosphate triphosphohydrolase [Desulfobacteraceae bacterium IS3]HAO23424.1 deoxyguanosinetriphosphate triphosphohydrolase [Desulfobacteraceae bacterium]